MSASGSLILQYLHEVSAQRKLRADDAGLALRVRRVKQFQHARFEKTYADMLADPRYAAAARFFLDDLYGPGDFTQRDDEFARIVPALVRLFPQDIVATVMALAQLHALSESLDSAMARAIDDRPLDGESYGRAWRAVGRPQDRERQVTLMLSVGAALDRYTRNPVLRHSLRLMRGPSQAAGLAALQRFLETGFETFRAMKGAAAFLDAVATRERALAARLFDGGSVPGETSVP
jgi:hypothetical protein